MMESLVQSLPLILVFLAAITVHEYSHGWAAYQWGDDTAKLSGRLTLNPLAHLDPLGTLFFIISGMRFGWAKPVPVDFYRLRDLRKGMFWVAIAGPAANLAFSLASVVLLKSLIGLVDHVPDSAIPGYLFLVNLFQLSVVINISLCVFNLLPLPVLDGSKIIISLLPRRIAGRMLYYERYGLILLVLMVLPLFRGGSFINIFLVPIIEWANNFLINL